MSFRPDVRPDQSLEKVAPEDQSESKVRGLATAVYDGTIDADMNFQAIRDYVGPGRLVRSSPFARAWASHLHRA